MFRKLITSSLLLLALTGCDCDGCKVPMPKGNKDVLSKYGLTEEDAIHDLIQGVYYRSMATVNFFDEPHVFETFEEYNTFRDGLDPEDYHEALEVMNVEGETSFGDNKLIMSQTFQNNYYAYYHSFIKAYYKGDTLYLYYYYHDYLPPDVQTACVGGCEFYTFYVSVNRTFSTINTIIERESDSK